MTIRIRHNDAAEHIAAAQRAAKTTAAQPRQRIAAPIDELSTGGAASLAVRQFATQLDAPVGDVAVSTPVALSPAVQAFIADPTEANLDTAARELGIDMTDAAIAALEVPTAALQSGDLSAWTGLAAGAIEAQQLTDFATEVPAAMAELQLTWRELQPTLVRFSNAQTPGMTGVDWAAVTAQQLAADPVLHQQLEADLATVTTTSTWHGLDPDATTPEPFSSAAEGERATAGWLADRMRTARDTLEGHGVPDLLASGVTVDQAVAAAQTRLGELFATEPELAVLARDGQLATLATTYAQGNTGAPVFERDGSGQLVARGALVMGGTDAIAATRSGDAAGMYALQQAVLANTSVRDAAAAALTAELTNLQAMRERLETGEAGSFELLIMTSMIRDQLYGALVDPNASDSDVLAVATAIDSATTLLDGWAQQRENLELAKGVTGLIGTAAFIGGLVFPPASAIGLGLIGASLASGVGFLVAEQESYRIDSERGRYFTESLDLSGTRPPDEALHAFNMVLGMAGIVADGFALIRGFNALRAARGLAPVDAAQLAAGSVRGPAALTAPDGIPQAAYDAALDTPIANIGTHSGSTGNLHRGEQGSAVASLRYLVENFDPSKMLNPIELRILPDGSLHVSGGQHRLVALLERMGPDVTVRDLIEAFPTLDVQWRVIAPDDDLIGLYTGSTYDIGALRAKYLG
ncbi:MAG: hypothetical protein JNK82_14370 [Myxococcaceae bacterium]|nr:hypothetical protein [Myxococcaceae bacterium]